MLQFRKNRRAAAYYLPILVIGGLMLQTFGPDTIAQLQTSNNDDPVELYSSEDIYRGVIFADGVVANLIPGGIL